MHAGAAGTPRQEAEPKVHAENGRAGIPGPNILSCLVDAGVFQKLGRNKMTTAKGSLVPSRVRVAEVFCPLAPARWEVDSRPVVNPSTRSRIIAHRPRFDEWTLKFALEVDETMIDPRQVRQLVDDAGGKVGLGDFRPATRGPFGLFVVTAWKEERAAEAA